MTLGGPQKLSHLFSKHRKSISLLKANVEKNFPDLKLKTPTPPTLLDGTVIDDLFYLRYVLSSKQPLDTAEQVEDSKTLKHIQANFNWRNSDSASDSDSEVNVDLLHKIPLLRTGELHNAFPVTFLPVGKLDLDALLKKLDDKSFEKEIFDFLLVQKNRIFKELDEKTRAKGELIKSVTVYDLNGLSFSSVYRIAKFFKMMQSQGKKFKQFFPQATHSTVIVNSPGAWVLKSFSNSSKQKVMSVKEFMRTYKAVNAVPDLIGGNFKWPQTHQEILEHGSDSSDSDENAVKEITMKPVAVQAAMMRSSTGSGSSMSPARRAKIQATAGRKLNKKVVLTELEEEMIRMKKNKLFSIDVLDRDQKVHLFFSNLRKKNANIFVVIKEKVNGKDSEAGDKADFNTFKNSAVLNPGFGSMTLNLKNPGEVLLVYLDRKRIQKPGSEPVELMNLKRSPAKRMLRFGKKLSKHVAARNHAGGIPIKELKRRKDLKNHFNLHHFPNGLTDLQDADKVLFRFDITDSVICGTFSGNKTISDTEISSLADKSVADKKLSKNDQGLLEYDDQSVISSRPGDRRTSKLQEPSFFRSAFGLLAPKY